LITYDGKRETKSSETDSIKEAMSKVIAKGEVTPL
jgi:hypothetical protein